jgi:hypothetical protein
MKNTVLIPLVFVGNLLLWTILLSAFSVPTSYASLMALSAGHFSVFTAGFVSSALYLLPISCMLSCLYLFFYLMRHQTLFFVSIPLTLVLVAASVIFLLPFSYRLSASSTAMAFTQPDASVDGANGAGKLFSPGLIRDGDGGRRVFWFNDSGAGRRARGVVVADRATLPGSRAMSVYPSADYDAESRQLSAGGVLLLVPAGGKDPLVAAHLDTPGFLNHLARDAKFLLDSFRSAFEKGTVSYYATVGSFFALVCCLFFICHASAWRLLNALLVFTLFRYMLMGYPYTTGGFAYDEVRRFLPGVVPQGLVSPFMVSAVTAISLVVCLAVFIIRKIRRGHAGDFQ